MNSDSNEPARPLPQNGLIKNQTLWLLLAASFVEGWFLFIIGDKSDFLPIFKLFSSLLNTIFIVRWCALDAAERAFKLSRNWIFAFVLAAPLVVPVYFFKTRGKTCWRPSGLALLFLLAMFFCVVTGAVFAQLLKL